ncbi:hypothetical protein DPMN_048688 [Dreissena polymorpha]|uniref:Uncharacterized protein n=1 Tax=Dreissena polymorpha TaxID=45954 RepID=A0A9D4DAG5_DREPO|nr:hypothetical protein DPMN_048688 [Dreissena polymorpha]
MIPERNLMAACGLQEKQQSKWVADITDMMAEGPSVVLRFEKLRKAIVASPEPMLWFSKIRMEMEMLQLVGVSRLYKCRDVSDAILEEIETRQVDITREV